MTVVLIALFLALFHGTLVALEFTRRGRGWLLKFPRPLSSLRFNTYTALLLVVFAGAALAVLLVRRV